MTEKQMLEFAAKAAGYQVARLADDGESLLLVGIQEPWNPLEDDGAAQRLAAHLRLRILPGKYKGDGCTVEPHNRPGIVSVTVFRDSGDMAEQMRRAIVMVAAAIGEQMK